MLTDAGPLVAIGHKQDANHDRAIEIISRSRLKRFVTVWACFTEAMPLLGRRTGFAGQRVLWDFVRDGSVAFIDLEQKHIDLAEWFMVKYQNVPMDLADACVMAVSDRSYDRRIFSFDGDFLIYRYRNGRSPIVIR